MTIWLIGGTQESATIAQELVQLQVPTVVTVVTESARCLYPAMSFLQVWVGSLTPPQIQLFLQQYQVHAILDASHPFAVDISRLAIATAADHNLPYLRYERPFVAELNQPEQNQLRLNQSELNSSELNQSKSNQTAIERFETFEALLQTNQLAGERVLLTVGYRSLNLFAAWQERCCLFARILPSLVALEAALQAGFTADRLIALRPPISAALEKSLWQQWQISTVVTKASGTAGGEAVKQHLAAELAVKLIVIDRPSVSYPQMTNDLQQAVAFCRIAKA